MRVEDQLGSVSVDLRIMKQSDQVSGQIRMKAVVQFVYDDSPSFSNASIMIGPYAKSIMVPSDS